MRTKEEFAVFLNVLALLALRGSAAELPGVQKVLVTQSPEDPHSYTLAVADPAQHGKKASFCFGTCVTQGGGHFPGIRSAEGHECTFSGYCSAVENVPIWYVFLTQPGLNQSPDLG